MHLNIQPRCSGVVFLKRYFGSVYFASTKGVAIDCVVRLTLTMGTHPKSDRPRGNRKNSYVVCSSKLCMHENGQQYEWVGNRMARDCRKCGTAFDPPWNHFTHTHLLSLKVGKVNRMMHRHPPNRLDRLRLRHAMMDLQCAGRISRRQWLLQHVMQVGGESYPRALWISYA